MIIGVDFDNTIVCYDTIFHRVAVERGLVPPEVAATKTAVRDYLRRTGNEPAFTEMQGYVYGPRLFEAEMFPGVKEFFRTCRDRGVQVKIISHKTRFPYAGEQHDLHAAARGWLEHNGFLQPGDVALPGAAAHFELTKQEKLARIAAAGCDVFIDDLPELLTDPGFPAKVRRVLFDPMDAVLNQPAYERTRTWTEIVGMIFGSLEDHQVSTEMLGAARALFAETGMKLATEPVRLAGGGNNRVFAARNEQGTQFLLKQYFFQAGDGRNRFESERLFYRLAAKAAPALTPYALGWDAAARLGLFEMVEGRKLAASEIGSAELTAALGFVAALNQARGSPEARALPIAAEACFTTEEHCCAVDRRMARLAGIAGETAMDRDARHFVEAELSVAWAEVRAAVLACDRAGTGALPEAERCVSPSDFGFHNALRRPDGSLVFLDFEYAGWDDPAKMVGDFFCQPALPAPLRCFESFAAGIGQALGLSAVEAFVSRCRVLLPLFRLKWCGIMLNEFVQADHVRRAFALGTGPTGERKGAQLAAARDSLASLRDIFHGTTA